MSEAVTLTTLAQRLDEMLSVVNALSDRMTALEAQQPHPRVSVSDLETMRANNAHLNWT